MASKFEFDGTKEQEKREKQELIYEIWCLNQHGFQASGRQFTEYDSLFEIRQEYHRLQNMANNQTFRVQTFC